jgi:hypothetical protein
MKRFSVIAILSLVLLTSCFHKDVMTDRADDIASSLIYQGKEGNYIINKEVIFQASSKSSGRGFTKISGHNDFRISSYDLATGKLVARVNMKSGMDKGEFIILGVTEGKLWMYSIDPDLGLHYRNPKTLEVIGTQQKIAESPSFKALTLAKARWSELDRYFGFDWETNQLIITDIQGYTYHLNPDNFSVEKADIKMDPGFSKDYLSNSANFDEKRRVTLSGDNRVTPNMGYKESNKTSPSFLKGSVVIENNNSRLGQMRKHHTEMLAETMKNMGDSVKLYESTHKRYSNGDYYSIDMSDEQDRQYHRYNDQKQKYEEAESRFKYIKNWHPDKGPLSDDPMTFMVYYANNISDSSRSTISKVKANPDSSFTEVWKCELGGFYFAPDKAMKMGAYETVFSKGDPSFRYQWFDTADGKLVFILQLQMACIDMKTGKLLWSINI